MLKNYIDFFDDIFEKKNGVPEFYSSISYSKNDYLLFDSNNENSSTDKNIFFSLKYVPNYLSLKLKKEHQYVTRKIYDVKGYSIYLNGINSIDDYLQTQFKSKKRGSIRKYIKRLESSFNIRYKMFFGDIEDGEYDFVMQSLRKMLDDRFNQRQGTDIYKKDWAKFKNIIIGLIKEKKASLFVVFNENEPIAITANYHFENKIFFYGIPSYDIDYSSFRLGHIVIHKELEWCIENNYLVFDTGRGDFDYKKKWCNHIYNFDYHLIYKKKSLLAFLLFQKEYFKVNLINYLKAKRINVLVFKLKNLLRKKEDVKIKEVVNKYELLNVDKTDNYDLSNEINQIDKRCLRIKKIINDFLYLNVEHISNIKVYSIEDDRKFLITGKNKNQLIVVL